MLPTRIGPASSVVAVSATTVTSTADLNRITLDLHSRMNGTVSVNARGEQAYSLLGEQTPRPGCASRLEQGRQAPEIAPVPGITSSPFF